MTTSATTTQAVADRYYQLAQQDQWLLIQDELYATDVVNKEPEHALAMGVPTITKGLDAIRAKGEARRAMIETLHSQTCSQPIVAASFFTMSMGRDITFKDRPRTTLEEIAIFEVRDGKIVLEQFFY